MKDSSASFGSRAFTLVELLVVIGIIVVLIAILLPVLRKARESANAVVCQSNMRQIHMAFMLFASDHQDRLPGSRWDRLNAVEWKRDWLTGDSDRFADAPGKGTIYRYLRSPKVYLCPSMDRPTSGSGEAVNYDYAMWNGPVGAKVSKLKRARFGYWANMGTGPFVEMPCPILVQEEPYSYSGGTQPITLAEGNFSGENMSHAHRGGSYFVASDGSVHFFVEPRGLNTDLYWWAQPPSGQWHNLGMRYRWGEWDAH